MFNKEGSFTKIMSNKRDPAYQRFQLSHLVNKLQAARKPPHADTLLTQQQDPVSQAVEGVKALKVVTKSGVRRVFVRARLGLSRLDTHLLIKHLM